MVTLDDTVQKIRELGEDKIADLVDGELLNNPHKSSIYAML